MSLTESFTNIHWLSVIVAAIAAFAVGSLWYSPLLFGKAWQKMAGMTDEQIQSGNMAAIFGTTFILTLIGAVLLDVFLGAESSVILGLKLGLTISIAWIAASIGINYLYNQKPFKLYLIDAGYFVLFYAVEGIILGAW